MRKTDPFAHKKNEIIVYLIVGILLIGLFSAGLFRHCSALVRGEGTGYVIPVLGNGFMVLFGILCLSSANTLRKRYKYYSAYANTLCYEDVSSVETIASLMNLAPDIVRSDVEKMYVYGYIQKGFPNEDGSSYTVYIGNAGVEMNGPAPKTYQEINEEKQRKKKAKKEEHVRVKAAPKEAKRPDTHKKDEYVTVTCKSCGGIMSIPHDSDCICDYCGSKIKF